MTTDSGGAQPADSFKGPPDVKGPPDAQVAVRHLTPKSKETKSSGDAHLWHFVPWPPAEAAGHGVSVPPRCGPGRPQTSVTVSVMMHRLSPWRASLQA
jgi:hypothetical protein